MSKRPELAQLKCFGTDGEAALVKAFSAVFIKAVYIFVVSCIFIKTLNTNFKNLVSLLLSSRSTEGTYLVIHNPWKLVLWMYLVSQS